MDSYDFDAGFDLDFSCMDEADFGLAKTFTTAPMGLIAPGTSLKEAEAVNVDRECEEYVLDRTHEIKQEGFCMKFYPTQD
jgi:hypothetical protein